MKNYIVSLDGIISANKSDVSLAFDNIDIKKIANNDSMFSLESTLDKSMSLEYHINNILMNDKIPIINQIVPMTDKLYLNIGVFYDTASCTVILPNESIVKLLSAFPQIYVRTVCYPCEDETKSA